MYICVHVCTNAYICIYMYISIYICRKSSYADFTGDDIFYLFFSADFHWFHTDQNDFFPDIIDLFCSRTVGSLPERKEGVLTLVNLLKKSAFCKILESQHWSYFLCGKFGSVLSFQNVDAGTNSQKSALQSLCVVNWGSVPRMFASRHWLGSCVFLIHI